MDMDVMANDSLLNATAEIGNETASVTADPSPTITIVSRSIVSVGVVANLLTVLVMSTKRARKMSVSALILTLSVSDSACLWCNSLMPLTQILGKIEEVTSPSRCFLFFWFRLTFALISSWAVVGISVGRFIAVCFPLHARRTNTPRNILVTMGVIILASATYTLAYVLTWGGLRGGCRFENIVVVPYYLSFLYAVLYLFLPLPLLLILNSFTAFTLCHKPHIKHRNFTAMVLVMSSMFVVLMFPSMLAQSRLFSHASQQLRYITQLLVNINYSGNFFIYVLVGKRFRRIFLSPLGRGNAVSPSGGDSTSMNVNTVAMQTLQVPPGFTRASPRADS